MAVPVVLGVVVLLDVGVAVLVVGVAVLVVGGAVLLDVELTDAVSVVIGVLSFCPAEFTATTLMV